MIAIYSWFATMGQDGHVGGHWVKTIEFFLKELHDSNRV